MNKEQLLARATELQIEVPNGATNAQISDLILIAEHPNLTKALAIANDEFEGQKELTAKAVKERDENATLLTEANNKIAELEDIIAVAKTSISEDEADKPETYKNDDGEFSIAVETFRFKGEKHNAAEAIQNPAIMEALITAKFIHLKTH